VARVRLGAASLLTLAAGVVVWWSTLPGVEVGTDRFFLAAAGVMVASSSWIAYAEWRAHWSEAIRSLTALALAVAGLAAFSWVVAIVGVVWCASGHPCGD
jgi:hypothetical protein